MVLTREQTISQILDHLNADARLFASDIYVDVRDGKVTLSGMVPTLLARKAAEENAFMVPQVLFVENFLKVRELEEHLPGSDYQLREEVGQALRLNEIFEHYPISVEVIHGEVTLEGSVDIYWKKLLAERIASSLKDVRKVINHVKVIPVKRVVDEIVARRILIQLARNKNIKVKNLSIHVIHGIVTITGKIQDIYAASLLKKIVLSTLGVIDFNDRLVIENDLL